MLRKAILIGRDDASARTNGPLPGAKKDIDDLCAFLTSPHGGAWNAEEIDWYPAPRLNDDLRPALRQAKAGFDYVFIAIVGHGGRDPKLGSHVSLNNEEGVRIDELASLGPRAKRVLVHSGACRNLAPYVPEKRVAGDDVGYVGAVPSVAYARSCRAAFDSLVMRATEGVVVMHSCSTGESSWYTPRGGFFTQALLRYASQWARTNSNGKAARLWHGVEHVFQRASAQTYSDVCQAVGRIQTPEILPAARPAFPFVIA